MKDLFDVFTDEDKANPGIQKLLAIVKDLYNHVEILDQRNQKLQAQVKHTYEALEMHQSLLNNMGASMTKDQQERLMTSIKLMTRITGDTAHPHRRRG